MLKKVRIKNFLSCEDTELDLDQITVLIGRNAAGKTNILGIIQWISRFTWEYGHFLAPPPPPYPNKSEIDIEFLIKNERIRYFASFTYPPSDIEERLSYCADKEWKILAKKQGEKASYYDNEITHLNIKSLASVVNSIIAFLPDEKIHLFIKYFIEQCKGVGYYTLESKGGLAEVSGGFFHEMIYLKWLSDTKGIASDITMRLVHTWKIDKDLFNELQELVGKNGLGLIDEILVNYTLSDSANFYTIKVSVNKNKLTISELSYGTKRVLMLLLDLLYDKNTIMLIEQPEDGIHLGLLRKVLSICFEYAEVYNKQLIITTHSPEVINMFQPENVRLVKMTENGTKVSSFDKEQIPLIYDYIENEGALFDFIKSMNED